MDSIFLSASVPQIGRGNYHETADPFLIQFAVRELVITVIKTHRIVWGGHPAITPMLWAICKDLNVDYSKSVVLYQSNFFEDRFPEENKHFNNVVLIDAVPKDREASLLRMRRAMLNSHDFSAAVFIGGMEGVEVEYELFSGIHSAAQILPIAAPGGAARQLAEKLGVPEEDPLFGVDFSHLFHAKLIPTPESNPPRPRPKS